MTAVLFLIYGFVQVLLSFSRAMPTQVNRRRGLGWVGCSTFGIDLAVFYFCYFSKMTVNIIKKKQDKMMEISNSAVILKFVGLCYL